jgi:hypothetical protein
VLCPCGYAGLKHYAGKDHAEAWRTNRKSMKRKVKAAERAMFDW